MGIDGMAIAIVLHKLGAGRIKDSDLINHSVGAELLVDPGQQITKGLWSTLCVCILTEGQNNKHDLIWQVSPGSESIMIAQP